MAQSREKSQKGTPAARGLTSLLKFGKRERQVSPSPEDNKGENKACSTKKNLEEKRAERGEKRAKKEDARRIKEIEQQHRLDKRNIRKSVRQDLAKTSCETFVTFCFIVAVGTTLFGGGTALIISGRENNIVDFIVVGSSGIIIGTIFTSAGLVLIFKPVYDNYQSRKRELNESGYTQPPGAADLPFYFDDVQRTILMRQLVDEGRRSRRPSNVELYGDAPSGHPAAGDLDISFGVDPRAESEPPRLAVPNIVVNKTTKSKNYQDPVYFLDADEEATKKHVEGVQETVAVVHAEIPIGHSSGGERNNNAGVLAGLGSNLELQTDRQDSGLRDDEKYDANDRGTPPEILLQREGSESPIVVETNKPVVDTTGQVRPSSKATSDVKSQDGSYEFNTKTIPTLIVDRENSENTIRSKVQTPSSVLLTYDKETFDTDL